MTLSALCDISPMRQEACRKQFPQAAVYSSVEELLEARAADAVIVAVPHPMHSEIAIAALRADCHVMVEKPVDVAISKAQQLCSVARESGKVFGVMLNQRNNPLSHKAREIVQSGALGALLPADA